MFGLIKSIIEDYWTTPQYYVLILGTENSGKTVCYIQKDFTQSPQSTLRASII